MGFPIPNLKPYDLYLYPTYPGGPTLRSSRDNKIDGNSSFNLPKTAFTPSYGVNTTPTTNRANATNYFTLNSDGSLGSKPISSAPTYSNPLNLDLGNSTGGIKTGSTSGAPPLSPKKYEEYLRFLAISDYNITDLMAQPEFKLPGIGLGLRVETDGAGNVTNVAIDPSLQGIRRNAGPFDPSFPLTNRAEINERAILNSPGATLALDNALRNQRDTNATSNLPNRIGVDVPLQFSGLKDTAGLFKLGGPQFDPGRFGLGPERVGGGENIFLERLAALQPPEPGIAVTGGDAELSNESARQIATSQAKLDINLSAEFRQNIAQLVGHRMANGDAYQTAKLADGRIPMAPNLPQVPRTATENGSINVFGQALDLAGAMSDAVDKKGSGGYVPFQMNSGTGGDSGGQSNPFSNPQQNAFGGQNFNQGAQQQPQPKPYQPLAFIA